MGAFGNLTLTNRGKILQSKAQTGVNLNFTRIAMGDGELGSTSILELNALISQKKSLELSNIKVLGGGKALVEGQLSNADLVTGFYYREIGLFATDPDVGEILYCYGNAGALAEYIPAGGSTIIEKNIGIQTVVGSASNITATIDSSTVFATKKDIENASRTARFVIGTSFNNQGWGALDCNYLCDGVDDQVEINTAIAALPATGGEIVILDGTYNITASISVNKSNTSIKGSGNATLLKRMLDTVSKVINITQPNCKLENINVDGNISVYTAASSNICVNSSDAKIFNNKSINGGKGIELNTAINCIISNNECLDNKTGIHIGSSTFGEFSLRNNITNNICMRGTGLTTDYAVDEHTIFIEKNCDHNIITNNNCMGKTVSYDLESSLTNNTLLNNKFDSTDDIAVLRESINTLDAEVDLKANKQQENWIAPTLLNGWVDYGGAAESCGYYKDSLGVVHLKGLIRSGATTIGTVIFNLPLGYRISAIRDIGVTCYAGSNATALGVIEIYTNGDVVVSYNCKNSWMSLDNISFRV